MKIDQYGLILSNGDGGDTCHRMYTYFIRRRIRSTIIILDDMKFTKTATVASTQAQLEVSPGIYIRNPDPLMWYSNPETTSRDQLTPVFCWHALLSNDKWDGALHRQKQADLLKQCLKRFMFAQNKYPNWVPPSPTNKKLPDLIGPDLWSVIARTWIHTKWAPLAFPFVILGDLAMILGSLVKCFAPIAKDGTLKLRMPGPDHVDDDNINSAIMVTQYVFPTPFSWLARKIYKKYRPINNGNIIGLEENVVMGALLWYHGVDNNELAEVARPIVERY